MTLLRNIYKVSVTLLTTYWEPWGKVDPVQTKHQLFELKRSFSYSGAMLWNNLPKNLRNAASVEHFKPNIEKVADISDSHTAIM